MNAEPNERSTSPTLRKRAGRLRSWGFRLVAMLLIPAMFFGAIEAGLRWTGSGYPTGFLKPSATQPGKVIDNEQFGWRFFPRALARSSQPLVIERKKPATVKRIIVFGGSAAMGDPEPAYGFPRLLEAMLSLRFPDQEFEIINAAMTAINSHVVWLIVKDCRSLDADAWVVYMGNNEVVGPYGAGTVFGKNQVPLWVIRAGQALQCTKTGQFLAELRPQADSPPPPSWGGMQMFLEHQLRRDDPSLPRVHRQFRANLKDILQLAARNHTPVVVGTVVTNLRSCPPFASLHRLGLTEEELQRWQSRYDQGCEQQQHGMYAEAIEDFNQAVEIDAEYAELRYRLGECLLETNDAAGAAQQFAEARDLDTLRFRTDSVINGIISEVARDCEDRGVFFVDAASDFAEHSPLKITGQEFLCEHVHFNFSGNYRLARLFADQLANALQLTSDDDWPTEEQCADRLGFTRYHRLLFAQELRMRFREPPFDQQLGHERRDEKLDQEIARLSSSLTSAEARTAVDRFRQLLSQYPHDLILRKQFGVLLEGTGELDEAIAIARELATEFSHHAEFHYRLGTLLNRAKRWPEAEQALRTALNTRPDYVRAMNSLAISLSHQGRIDESYAQFAKAVELQPSFAEAYLNWGLVLANQGDQDAAIERYQQAVQADADYLPAHVELGKFFTAREDFQAALPHYREVARLKPTDVAAHVNLGLLYLKLESRAEAIETLTRATELDPNNTLARQALSLARQQQSNERP